MNNNTNEYGQGASHASGDSAVPRKLQEKLPKGAEEAAPNSLHDTGSSGRQSHATGDSIVPKKIQEIVPEGVEKALPDSIHDTSGK
jgi:hypothetical protein